MSLLFPEAFLTQARNTNAIAVLDTDGRRLTYGALERRSRQLAHRLRDLGAGPEARIGILLERSFDMVTAVVAVLRSGAAYVPLDISHPPGRLRLLTHDAELDAVITRRVALDLGCDIVDIDTLRRNATDSGKALSNRSLPRSAAYVIYTSGSAGKPKGVVVEHRSLAWLLRAVRSSYGLRAGDRILQFSSLSFDLSVAEILPALACGATIVLRDDSMAASIEEFFDRCRVLEVTTVFPPTSFWHEMADAVAKGAEPPPSLRLVAIGTERVDARRVHAWLRKAGAPRLVNAYGATETTVDATSWQPSGAEDELERIPIGRPVEGVDVRVLAGELMVAGPGLARGYLGEPGLTAGAFVPHLEATLLGERLYRTGDRGRRLADGNLEILDRFDQQVKIRGFRVEPGEVELALSHHPAIRQAVVIPRIDRGHPYLAAFAVAAQEHVMTPALMRQHLVALLPAYMLPTAFVVLDHLPLTSSHKIDRQALKQLRLPRELSAEAALLPGAHPEIVPPEAALPGMEATLARIWSEVLGLDEVGVHDDFFTLGGDSILNLRIAARAHEAGIVLAPKHLFQHPTVAELARHAVRHEAKGSRRGVSQPPRGNVLLTPIQLWFFELDPAEPWHFNQAVTVELRQTIAPAALRRAVALLVEHHDALRLRFVEQDGEWRQRYADREATVPFIHLDLSRLAETSAARQRAAGLLQASLDLADGPLLRVAFFDPGENRPPRLLFAIHHLAVDTVSWHILLGDLERLCQQPRSDEDGRLPARTTSYQEWASLVEAHARREDSQRELDFFASLPTSVPPLPRDHDGDANLRGSADTVSTVLDKEHTDLLLHRVSSAYGIRIHEILLSAVARAVARWTDKTSVLIELESHGRENVFPGVDLSRTVGWFTTSYPLLLEVPQANEDESILTAVRDQMRAVPRNGFDFFLTQYLGAAKAKQKLRELAVPEIHFNYLGRLDAMSSNSFALASESTGRRRSPLGRRPALFEIEGEVIGGRLEIHWCYSLARHRRQTVASLATACIRELSRLTSECVAATGGDHREVEAVYPLTPVQKGLLFHALYAPESAVYHEQYDWDLDGGEQELDVRVLRRAWQALIERHAILRTAFAWRDLPHPLQIVQRRAEIDWRQVDLSTLTSAGQESWLAELVAEDRRRGFDLTSAPLMRCCLVHLGRGRFRFVWSLHHLLLDGWSVGLILDDLFALYAGRVRQRPRPFREYVAWLGRQDTAAAKRFWHRQLAGFTVPTTLAMATTVATRDSAYLLHGELERHLPLALMTRLDNFVRRRRLTWGTLLAGAWAVVLARTSGRHDVVFGSTAAGRPQSLDGSESMIGLLVQTLPLRVRVAPRTKLLPWLEGLRDHALEIREHGYCSLTDIRGWGETSGDHELFESMLGYSNFPGEASLDERRGPFSISSVRYFSQTNYPLTIGGTLKPTGLRLHASYDSVRFQRSAIARTLGLIHTVLQGFLDCQDLDTLTLLSTAQRHQLRWEWNPAHTVPTELCTPALFEIQAAKTPQAPAIVEALANGTTATWTYRELDRRARNLSDSLRDLGVAPDVVVGVLTERSFARMVALLGIWKAGGAFLLLDPGDPAERRAFMLADASALGVVKQEGLDTQQPDGFVVRIDSGGTPQRHSQNPERRPDVKGGGPVLPAHAAYVVYTSGSTGRPKGTVIPHSALAAFLETARRHCPLGGQDRMLVRIPATFDAGLIEIFLPLVTGARQVLAAPGSGRDPELLLDLVRRHAITATATVPSVLRMFFAELDGGACPSLRLAICGGEALKPDDLESFARAFPRATLWNAYGPVETTIFVATWQDPDPPAGRVPIGRPLSSARVHLTDTAGHEVAPGVTGELRIGGPQLARGYLGRPHLTAESLVPDAVAPIPGQRLYRSGDLARHLDDGTLDFLGRLDHQVKVRGVRIELSEVETVLTEHAAVHQAAVVARRAEAGDLRLVAFVVAGAAADGIGAKRKLEGRLREYLEAFLPEAMRPSWYVFSDQLPLLSTSGKVDRTELARYTPEAGAAAPSPEAARGPVETVLTEIWCQLLGLGRPPDRDANLFELGAHSLIATQAVSRIRRRFGIELALRQIFEAPTVARLATRVEAVVAEVLASDDDVEASCIEEWKTLTEALHSVTEAGETTGWTSSYTGRPIPDDEMREWVANTVARILEHAPRQVLEIGFGTGLLLFEVAPHSDRYLGTELSDVAVDKVGAAASERELPQVSVRCQPADNTNGIPAGAFDTVIINSVSQYFPSVHYLLRVLRGAVQATATGGRIFIGDVRNLLLHDLFCASVELFRAERGSTVHELRTGIRRRRANEKELLVDPTFFHVLRQELPRISHVALRPKSARGANEMALFRYDVILDLDGEVTRRHPENDHGELLALAWPRDVGSLTEVRHLLAGHRERVRLVSVHGIPDRRLTREVRLLALLEGTSGTTPTGGLATDEDDSPPGFEPADFLVLGHKLGYAVELAGPPFPTAGTFDLIFRPRGRTPIAPPAERDRPWSSYGNDPTASLQPTHDRADHDLPGPPTPESRPASSQPTALSFAQQRLWFVEQLTPGISAFNMLDAWQMKGSLNADALEASWREIVRRHEVLRTTFPDAGGHPRQEIETAATVRLPRIDLTALPEDRRLPEAERLALRENRRPLDLVRGPLYRLRLVKLSKRHHVFLKTLHHIVSDAWSEAILSRELSALYRTACSAPPRSTPSHSTPCRSPLPEPRLQYADFAVWQRGGLRGEAFERHLAYWREELDGLTPLELPTDRPRPSRRSWRGTTHQLFLPAPLTAGLNQLAESHQASLFMVLLASFMTLLRLYTGRLDFAVASPVANRSVRQTEDLVGFFVNSLILRCHDRAQEPRFNDFLAQIRRTTLAAYAHQDLPFERLVEELQPEREMDRQPLFQVVFALQNAPESELRLPELELSRMASTEEPLSCDMEWHLWQTPSTKQRRAGTDLETTSPETAGLEGYLVYDTALFDAARIERMVGHFKRLLEAIVADPELPMRAGAFLSNTEARQVLAERPKVRATTPRHAPAAPAFVAPCSALESDLLIIWSEVLEVGAIGVHDNFFDLGGHSLIATRVRSRIRERLGLSPRLRKLFEHPTVASLAAHLESTADTPIDPLEKGETPTPSRDVSTLLPIHREASGESAPVSFAQERLWFLDQMFPDRATYNMPRAWRLRGDLDRAAMRATWGEIVRRHEVLRATFPSPGGQPRQATCRDAWSSWIEIDLTRLPRPDRAAEGQRIIDREAVRPFHLAHGPLLRVLLIDLEPGREGLLLRTTHHIVSDGWSETIFDRELSAIYGALTTRASSWVISPLPEPPVQYTDYARWQRRWLSGQILDDQLRFWRHHLDGLEPLRLPTDRRRPAAPNANGAARPLPLDPSLTEALGEVHRRAGASLYMLLAAALMILLHRLSGQRDFAIGSPSANRNHSEVEGLVGFFVNMLVLRAEVDVRLPFDRFLRQIRHTVLEAQTHQDLPFERLVEALLPDRDPGRNPLFQVSLALNTQPSASGLPAVSASRTFPGLEATDHEIGFHPTRFDLTVYLTPSDNGLRGWLLYRTALFDDTTIDRLGRHFNTLLTAIAKGDKRAEGSDTSSADLPWLTPVEHHQLRSEWSCPVLPEDLPESCVDELFAAQAAHMPTATAVAWDGGSLSYRELDQRAEGLACHLRGLGVGPEVTVGLWSDRQPEMVVGLLAVLKAGGAYLPLDPDLPSERLNLLLEDSRPTVMLAHSSNVPNLDQHRIPLVLLNEAGDRPETQRSTSKTATRPSQTAYILYTSGSTGRPKGVTVEHRQLASYVRSLTARLALEPGWTYAMALPLSVDSSVTVLWPPLLTGGCLYLVSEHDAVDPQALRALVKRQPIDVLKIAPTHFAALTEDGQPLPFGVRRRLVFGGEILRPEPAARWQAAADCQIHNHYGPTETTVGVFTYRLHQPGIRRAQRPRRHFEAPSVPIGRPLDDATAYVGDDTLRPVPAGVAGELLLGGSCLARGYLRRPARTAASFIAHPWSAVPGARLYRTGDRVRYLAGGEVEFLGRRDHQVAIRGHRVELGEIESALSAHSNVRQAVARLTDEIHPGPRLVADVESDGPGSPSAGELRSWLAARLPSYMVPETLTIHQALPRAANGKVDRRALMTPPLAARVPETADAPSNAAEETLVGIWERVLGRQGLGVHDNFFELGGHSLLATRIVSRVRSVFRTELAVRHVFEQPTIAELAVEVAAAPAASTLPLTRATGHRRHPPLSFAQQRLWFLQWLAPRSAAYNIPYVWQLTGRLDVHALGQALLQVIRRHETLRTTFPRVEGRPVQRIASPPRQLILRIVDLGPRCQHHLPRLLATEALRPFDLTRDNVLRSFLVRLSERRHVLFLNIHHIASDGWSRSVLYHEIATFYRGHTLPELPIQYADFALWQRRWLASEARHPVRPPTGEPTRLAYWRRQLAGVSPLELPTDRPRPDVVSFRGASFEWLVPATVLDRLRGHGKRHGVSLYMTLLAAYAVLLQRLSGQSDIVVGSPIANRNRHELEGLIGFFVNMLVMRVDLGGNPRFAELLRRVRHVTLEAYAHQDLPFERLVDELAARRDTGHHPLFQAAIAVQDTRGVELRLPGLEVSEPAVETRASRFDLELFLGETGDELSAAWVYNTDLFDATTVARIAGQLTHLLHGLAADCSVAELPLLTVAQEHQLRVEWNDSAAPGPVASSLHQLFEWRVEQTPAALVTLADKTLSYRAISRRADRLAGRLRAIGIVPECFVGLFLERSFEMLVALLGVLKAGGAFVPLDPALPRRRLDFLLRDSGVRAVLTRRPLIERLPNDHPPVIAVEDASSSSPIVEAGTGIAVPDLVAPDNAAYMTYTSGSTGVPKGVVTTHRCVVAHLDWWQQAFPLGQSDVVIQKTTLGFDVAIWEIFAAFQAGARLALAQPGGEQNPDNLADLVASQEATFLQLVPSMVPVFLDLPDLDRCRSLRWLFCGGETLPVGAARHLRRRLPATDIVNLYGPTEATITATTWQYQPGETERVPIGRAAGNTRLNLLEANLQQVPRGAVGEIFLGGVQVTRGYHRRRRKTAMSFIPDDLSRMPGERLYKTGDLGRFRDDGRLDFLGRVDHQVKIRGVRVELGEIETALLRHPAVRAAAASTRQESGTHTLVAYVAANPTPTLARDLRAYLRQSLPDVMIPRSVVVLDQLPLLSHGKVDRDALAKAVPSAVAVAGKPSVRPVVRPRTPAEEILTATWRRFLDVDNFSVDDNFFDLGGDSILSIRIVAEVNRCHERHGLHLTAKDFFQHQTVAQLARVASRDHATRPVEVGGAREPKPGPVPLTPVQLDYLGRGLPASGHFNQATLLRTPPLEPEILEVAVAELLRRHASLRLRFSSEGGMWRQTLVSFNGRVPIHRLDVSNIARKDITEACSQLHRSLDLASGPLLRIGHFHLGTEEDLLLITIHHLAVDRVSWSILLEDLESACRGQALPPATTSFMAWAERLSAHATSDEARRELPIWQETAARATRKAARIPVDFQHANTLASAAELELSLDLEHTQSLKTARPQELLLLALVRCFAEWTGHPELFVELEGHGREELFESVDLTRTVGWFTSLYPMFLSLVGVEDPHEQLTTVGEQLRALPGRGLGHGVLYHLDGDTGAALRQLPRPEVLFNYLGQLEALPNSLFTYAEEPLGILCSTHGPRSHLLEINAAILDGRLQARWRYSRKIHRAVTIERLAQGFLSEIRGLLELMETTGEGRRRRDQAPSVTSASVGRALNTAKI